MSVYEWHDPWAWVARKQRVEPQPPSAPVSLKSINDPAAVAELIALAKRYDVNTARAAMMQVAGVTKLVQIPRAEQVVFVRQVRERIERDHQYDDQA
jgi:hypothetical protein